MEETKDLTQNRRETKEERKECALTPLTVRLEKLSPRKIANKCSTTPKRLKINTDTPLIVKLDPLTPKELSKFKPPIESVTKPKNLNFEPRTPKAHIEFSLELKKVINDRNILTSKTKKRVFDALDEIKTKSEEESRRFKREKALLEIVNSEIKYVHQLETLINFFIKPVQEKSLLKRADFETLFGNINTIYSINKELLEELDKGFDNVANAFSKIAPFFKLYSVYAYEFKSSLKVLQTARSLYPQFAQFIENQETRPEVQSKLSALLITPIQRVPRYKLLLTQLYELTTPEDKDYHNLTECRLKVEDAADHINKIVEDQENQQRLLELQRCLRSGEPNIITPGRKLQKDGILMKMSSKNTHSEKLYVVLMNDIIMFNRMKSSEPKVNSLKCSCIFPLNKCKIAEVLDKGCFKMTCQEQELILYHDQFNETKKWIGKIKECIERYVEDRKTLRKESSSRRPVKRKDVNEYHEVGVSPGQPLKKRKILKEPEYFCETPSVRNVKISARRSIHSVCNSTPIKQGDKECVRNLNVPLFNTNISLECDANKKNTTNSVFVFGQPEKQDVSAMSSFFKGVGSKMKNLFGFKS